MKRIFLMVVAFLMLGSLVFGASVPLKFMWDYNIDSVTVGYKLYRTDGARVLLGAVSGKTPALPYLVTVNLPDGVSGTATFVLTAYSVSGVESADSNVVSVPFDFRVPAVPSGLRLSP